MDIYYDPLDRRCKSVCGGIRQNETCKIKILWEGTEPCMLILKKDGHEAQPLRMQKTQEGWEIDLSFADCGLYFYHFRIGKREAGMGELRRLSFAQPVRDWQLLIFAEDFTTPDWFKGGVMYQIFPDRFYREGALPVAGKGKWMHKEWNEMPAFRANAQGKILNNDFFGGNLKGIAEKLPYLVQLGVTSLYLNPVFRAYSNHRYDTGDYMQIDPLLGSEEDLIELAQQCKKRGIRLILDGVFNHTGDDSRYFNKYGNYDSVGAYQSKQSPYYDWFTFRSYPDKYDSWWGIDVLPAVNENSPSYREFITGENGVLRHWLRAGIAGWRLDVADELPDEFVEEIRSAAKAENDSAIIIGEVWEDASNKIAYSKRRRYFQGKELDSVMNYPLKNAIINFVTTNDVSQFRETVAMLRDNYPKCVLDSLMNILGTHDTFRILTALGGVPAQNKEEMSVTKLNREQRAAAKERLKAASILQYTVFGVPCVYYGDEAGMEGYADPFCRCPFPWDSIDEDLHVHYKKLGKIRKNFSVFFDSEYKELFSDKNCVVYERRKGDEVIVVCVNRGSNRFDLRFNGKLYDLLNGGKEYDGCYTLRGEISCILSNKNIF